MSGWLSRRFHWDSLRKQMLLSSLGLILVGLIGRSLPVNGQGTAAPGSPITVTRLIVTYGTYTSRIRCCLLTDKERIVVRDRATWESVWTRNPPSTFVLGEDGKFKSTFPPLPEIDFAKETLIVVSMGQQPTSGYSITVEGAKEFADRIEIEVQSVSPNRNQCSLLTMSTTPIDVVRLPRTDKTVVFHETEVVKDCK
ncbi:MAG TPA: hypothetical protein DC054_08455 [Blastocatellia bacterium]|nr:hypothetical protein [Blastocatellia bacterium]